MVKGTSMTSKAKKTLGIRYLRGRNILWKSTDGFELRMRVRDGARCLTSILCTSYRTELSINSLTPGLLDARISHYRRLLKSFAT